MLSTLLFDVDGTIAQTEEEHRNSFNTAFQKAGLNWFWSKSLYSKLLKITGGRERIEFYIDKFCPGFDFPTNKSTFIAELHEIKTKNYQKKLKTGKIELRPGMKRLIQEARDNEIQLGIVTTTTPKNVTTLLQQSLDVNSLEWFDIIAAGDVVCNKKPAPDIYHYVIKNLNLNPNSCLAIEDTQNGLLSAHYAGIKTIVTVSQYSKNQDFSRAELVVNHLGEPNHPSRVIHGTLNCKSIVDLKLLMEICKN